MKSELSLRIAIWHTVNKTMEDSPYYDLFVKHAYLLKKATGINVELLEEVDLSLNKKLQNGSWTGVIGMVKRGEADLALERFVVTAERLDAVDFMFPFLIDDYTFATKHPEYSPEMFSILYPFEFPVWITLALFLILVTAVFFVAFGKKSVLENVLLHQFAAITGQTTKIKIPNMCCRFISFSWIFGMMFLANCYKSVLLSFLTFPPLKGVQDFKELTEAVQQGRYQCIIEKNSIIAHLLANSDIETYKILGENILQSPIGYGDVDALFQNPNANIAYLGPKSVTKYLSRKFFISNDQIYPILVGHAMRKDLFCKQELNEAAIRITDSGIFMKLFRDMVFLRSLRKFAAQSNEDETSERKLSFYEISGLFVILICGYFVSAIALAIEMFYYKHY